MNVLVYHVRTFTVVQGRGVVEADTTHVNKIGPFFFGTMILGCANIVRWTLRARAEQKERRPKKKQGQGRPVKFRMMEHSLYCSYYQMALGTEAKERH